MDKVKILEKYGSVAELEFLENKLSKRFNKYGRFGLTTSIAVKNYVEAIEDILGNEDNFVFCDLCMVAYTPANITEKFDGELSVCQACIENYYRYCEVCFEPIYVEGREGEDYYILDDMLFCPDHYFEEKEYRIKNRKIKDKKLQVLQNENRDVEDVIFKIKGYDFTVENYLLGGGYRLGSWGANFWADLTSDYEHILQAIDWVLENNLHCEIEEVIT